MRKVKTKRRRRKKKSWDIYKTRSDSLTLSMQMKNAQFSGGSPLSQAWVREMRFWTSATIRSEKTRKREKKITKRITV